MWRYLRDPTLSRFDTIPECDRHTHTHTHTQRERHTTTAYTALSIASRGKNFGSDLLLEVFVLMFSLICTKFGHLIELILRNIIKIVA